MLNKLLLASLGFAMAACTPCDPTVTIHGLAPRPQYDVQIDACITKKACIVLCRQAFDLAPSVDIESCKIELVDPANAHLIVKYDDDSCSVDDSADISVDDGDYSGDDGGGTVDDGSDDGSNEGSDDSGGGDDGSTTDGGDDGGGDSGGDSGGDDGGDRHAPKHAFVKSVASQTAGK